MKVFVGNLYKGFVEGNVSEWIIDVKEGVPASDDKR